MDQSNSAEITIIDSGVPDVYGSARTKTLSNYADCGAAITAKVSFRDEGDEAFDDNLSELAIEMTGEPFYCAKKQYATEKLGSE